MSRKTLYPLLYAYGSHQKFLNNEEMIAASPNERIRSIWPFIASRAIKFHESLNPRDRINFDPEDVVSDLWIAIQSNNDQWDPERGKYITFAGVIIDRELCSIRDKARTVQSPRNSSCRMKEYEIEETDGTITERRKKTADDIRRTIGEIRQILVTNENGSQSDILNSEEKSKLPIEEACAHERGESAAHAIRRSFRKLTTDEANIIGRTAGLWGRKPESTYFIALVDGRLEEDVRKVKSKAYRKIRRYLTSIKHISLNSEDKE